MAEFLSKAINFISTYRRVNGLELEPDLKRKIWKTWLGLAFPGRRGAADNTADIAGYTVKYCTRETLIYLFRGIFMNQEYRFTSSRQNPFIIDCGSNIGMSVLYFKLMYPMSSVLAFEPDEDAFACLEANISVNGLDSVEINKKALSKSAGEIDFFYYPDNPGALSMSLSSRRTPGISRKAEAVRLSGFLCREVDFLKMDIEGAETEVIEELYAAKKLRLIEQMAIEYHHQIPGAAPRLSKMLVLLESAGFGYQVGAALERPFEPGRFQDIIIYAYRKGGIS